MLVSAVQRLLKVAEAPARGMRICCGIWDHHYLQRNEFLALAADWAVGGKKTTINPWFRLAFKSRLVL